MCQRSSNFSEVFSSLELAKKAGREEIDRRIAELQEADKFYASESREFFIKEEIEYLFQVFEFDPVRRERGILRTDGENITLANSVEFSREIEWDFNYDGVLRRRLECIDAGYEVHPDDYAENAGTLFKKGDLVTSNQLRKVMNNEGPDVYVVGEECRDAGKKGIPRFAGRMFIQFIVWMRVIRFLADMIMCTNHGWNPIGASCRRIVFCMYWQKYSKGSGK